jgi:hypothetical protein
MPSATNLIATYSPLLTPSDQFQEPCGCFGLEIQDSDPKSKYSSFYCFREKVISHEAMTDRIK